jgi:hypothetical protein
MKFTLALNSRAFCLSLLGAGIIGMYHLPSGTELLIVFYFN